MEYVSLLKWDLYAGIKRRILNIKFFKSLNTRLVIGIYSLISLFKICAAYGLAVVLPGYIHTSGGRLVGNDIVNSVLGEVLTSMWLLAGLVVAYVVFTVIKRINDVSKLTYINRYIQWLDTNTNIPHHRIILCFMGNYNLLESNDLFTILVPVFTGCFVNRGYSFIMSLLQGILLGILIFMVVYLCSIWRYIWLAGRKKIGIWQRVVINIVRIGLIMCIFTRLGMFFSDWMNRFPLVKRKVEVGEFELWVDEIKNKLAATFPDIQYFVEKTYRWININSVMAVLSVVLILFCISVFKFSSLMKYSGRAGKVVCNGKGGKSSLDGCYFASVFRGVSLRQNIKYAFGGYIFWAFISFYGGLMTGVHNDKVMFFLTMTCAVYASLFLAQSLMRKFNVIYTLDGEGKRIRFWTDNFGKLMELKERIWILNVLIITVVEYKFLHICSGSSYMLSAALLQVFYMITLIWLYNIPSIIFPYFEYKNYEELIKYADREKIYDIIDGVMILVVNSLFVIPTAIYMTDYISFNQYMLIQFGVVAAVNIIARAIVKFIISRKIRTKKYKQKIFAG